MTNSEHHSVGAAKSGCVAMIYWTRFPAISRFAKLFSLLLPLTVLAGPAAATDLAEGTESPFTPDIGSSIEKLTELLKPAKGTVTLEISGARPIRLNQTFIFQASSNISGKLVIIDINANSDVTQIFPNSYTTSEVERIEAGEIVKVPDSSYGFDWFRASEPVGSGLLIALIVPGSFPSEQLLVHQARKTKGLTLEERPRDYLESLSAQISSELTRDDPQSASSDNWAVFKLPYEIVR
ncbi:DUF4384 domain-containing protein [uncultured Cohaesibacter sp.]|uniref:DUF4384 domain-containing protein n=1 Tax=uncultured Cohaesibacter sp. TaxID=1002546 RepID=UPI0029C7B8A1|nr:DUF4384 domain-containing protein [uncultured Cohaesibacter sp.]